MISANAVLEAKQANLLDLIGKYTKLTKVAAREYAGACVRCGGVDRFRLNLDRGWFCRQCQGSEHWHDAIDFIRFVKGCTFTQAVMQLVGNASITPEELAKITAERERQEKEQKEKDYQTMIEARQVLNESNVHLQYNANLEAYQRGMDEWHARGLSNDWIAYYGLGYCPERDSLTIPYWRFDVTESRWDLIGLRHRLLTPTEGGKYRPEIPGLGNHLFYTDPMTKRFFGNVILVEGEVKAMVTWAAFWDDMGNLRVPSWWVIGLPGKSWKPEFVEVFEGADKVFICLDPDAGKEAARFADAIGERAKVVTLPDKIDDLINGGVIDVFDLVAMMN
jgi:hypothetical protein